MTTREFVEWIKTTYGTKTLKEAMIKASNFLGVSEHAIKARMKKTAISENVTQAMKQIVENPPPSNYIASGSPVYAISEHVPPTKSEKYKNYVEKSRREKEMRRHAIMSFFEKVKIAHNCKSMKEAARISASLLGENFNTVYYWAKGLSSPSQDIIDRVDKIILTLPEKQDSRQTILQNFLKWVAEKYGKTQPRDIYNQAASFIGVSPATIARWIRKNSPLKISIIEHIESLMVNKDTKKDCVKFLEIEVGIESDKSKSDIMSVLNFINWVQSKYTLPNRTTAVKKTAGIMKAGENTVWQWLNGKRNASPTILQFMATLLENDALKKRVKELEEKLNQK